MGHDGRTGRRRHDLGGGHERRRTVWSLHLDKLWSLHRGVTASLRLVKRVRERLAAQGVDGLVPEPGSTGYDSAHRRNLIDELVDSGTLGPPDLRLLGLDDE